MKNKTELNNFVGLKLLLALASLIIVIGGLQKASSLLIPFAFAIFLAILGSSPLVWLKKKGVPSYIAIALVTTMLVFFLSLIIYFLGRSLNEFTLTLPAYRRDFNAFLEKISIYLNSIGYKTSTYAILNSFDPNNIFNIFTTTIGKFVGAISKIILVIIITVFVLIEAVDFQKKIRATLNDSLEFSKLANVTVDIQHYLGIKTITCTLTGILVGTFVYLMNIDFPLLWGIVAFFLNYIPFIGSIIASIPAIFLALVKFGLWHASFTAIGYIVINIGISNFLEPILMGRRLGLSPLVVFSSLIFWGWVWGPAGMLLSIPLTMVIKIFLEHSEDFHWVAVLMDIKPPK